VLDQKLTELDVAHQANDIDLPMQDDEWVIAVSAPTSNKEWQE